MATETPDAPAAWVPPEVQASRKAWVPPEVAASKAWVPPEVADLSRPLETPPDFSEQVQREGLADYLRVAKPRLPSNIELGSTEPGALTPEADTQHQTYATTTTPLSERGILANVPRPEGDSVIAGAGRGALNIVDAATTPTNLGLLVSGEGIPKAVSNIAMAGFTGQGAQATAQEVLALKDAKTPGQVAEHVVGALAGGLMTAGAAAHMGGRSAALSAESKAARASAPETVAALEEQAQPAPETAPEASPKPEQNTATASPAVPSSVPTVAETPARPQGTEVMTDQQATEFYGTPEKAKQMMPESGFVREGENWVKKPATPPLAETPATTIEEHAQRQGYVQPPAEEPSPAQPQGSEGVRTPAQERAREEAHVSAYDLAEKIGNEVARGQPDSVREAAVMAAYDNARSSIESSPDSRYNPEFMRRNAMRAAGAAAKKQGISLDEPASEDGQTRGEAIPSEAPTPSEATQSGELHQQASDLLSKLNDREQDIVRRHTMDDQSFQEIADDLGISRQRVQQIHSAALDKLRSQMEQSGYSGGPGAMGPVEAGEMTGKAAEEITSTKNAVMEAERAQRGEDPVLKEAKQSNQATVDQAEAELDAKPTLGREVVEKHRDGDVKNISLHDEAILLVEKVRLRNERDLWAERAADPDSTPEERTVAKREWESLESQINDIDQATHATGAEWGRLGQFRQRLLRSDFTLEAMERRARVEKGDKLTEAESAKIKEQAKEIADLQKKLAEREKQADAQKSDTALHDAFDELKKRADAAESATKIAPRVLALAEGIVTRLDKAADAARARIRERLGKANAAVDPTVVYDVAVIGLSKLGHASLDFAKWSAEMTADLGEWVKPYLKDAWDQADKMWKDEEKRLGANSEPVNRVRRKAATDAERQKNVTDRIKERVKEGDSLSDLRGFVQQLALSFVKSGVKERGELVMKVHNVLKDITEITPAQTRDLISGYGEFKPLSTEPAKVTLRGLKGEMQQIAKLESMLAKEAPKKTGVERRTPTDEERRLIKEVNEMKKKGGFVVTDPAQQLKTALDAVKTRLRNDIRDIDLALAKKEPIPNRKGGVEYDAEANALKKERDAKKAAYDEAFPKAEKTDAQKIEQATKAVQKSIADYDRRLREGDTKTRSKTGPTNDALDALRAERDAMKALMDELRAAEKPKLSDDARALKSYKARTAAKIAELQQRIAVKNFEPKPKREPFYDKEALDLRYRLNEIKKQYNQDRVDAKMGERSIPRKALDLFMQGLHTRRTVQTSLDLSAVFRQGGFLMGSHPIRGAKIIPEMLRAAMSKKEQFRSYEEIMNRPTAQLYQQAKLFLHDPHNTDLSKMEEAYMSNWAENIPLVAGSERAYTTFLNRLRADSFDALLRNASRNGEPVTLDEAKAIANFVNVATGRGNLASAMGKGVNLNAAFFSPRFVTSRFELATGAPLMRGTARTRALIAKEYARALTAAGVAMLLLYKSGAKVSTDPTDSDFGKVVFGNTRIDFLAGLAQTLVFLSRTTAAARNALQGKANSHSVDYIGAFLRSKLNPTVGGAMDALSGKSVTGDKVAPSDVALRMIVPLSISDVMANMKDNGIPKGTLYSLLTMLGINVNTYEKSAHK